jgi:hypothetical protein
MKTEMSSKTDRIGERRTTMSGSIRFVSMVLTLLLVTQNAFSDEAEDRAERFVKKLGGGKSGTFLTTSCRS